MLALILFNTKLVWREGLEPPALACSASVFPLNQRHSREWARLELASVNMRLTFFQLNYHSLTNLVGSGKRIELLALS